MPLLRLSLAFLLACPLPLRAEEDAAAGFLQQAGRAIADAAFAAANADTLRKIYIDGDVAAARAWLADEAAQRKMRGASEFIFDKVFRRATEIVDLHQVLTDFSDVAGLRGGLRARSEYEFLLKPERLYAWAPKAAPGIDVGVLKEALYEWSTLDVKQQRYLTGRHRVDEKGWSGAAFAGRLFLLNSYARAGLEDLLKENPKTRAAYQALHPRVQELWPMLSVDDQFTLSKRMTQWSHAVGGLETASGLLADAGNKELEAKLKLAREAGDTGKTLDLIGQIFDGLGVQNSTLDVARESRSDESLTEADRVMLSTLMSRQYVGELHGTGVGADVHRMIRRNKFTFEVKDIGPGALMHYDPNGRVIRLNQRYVEEYMRGRGHSRTDLLTKAAALRPLVLSTLPSFVHEAIHWEQDLWAKSNGVPVLFGQEAEVEAKGKEALFVLQKGRRDKSYVKFLRDNAESNAFARASLEVADSLYRDPQGFARHIRTHYYSQTPSYRTHIVSMYEDGTLPDMVSQLEGEVRRRRGLPQAQRDAIDNSGFTLGDRELSMADWIAGTKRLPQAQLDKLLADIRAVLKTRRDSRGRVIDINSAYRGRDAGVIEYLANGIDTLGKPLEAGDSVRGRPPPEPGPARPREAAAGPARSFLRFLGMSPADPHAHSHGGVTHSHAVSPNIPHVHPEIE